jgi:hypothetical protein
MEICIIKGGSKMGIDLGSTVTMKKVNEKDKYDVVKVFGRTDANLEGSGWKDMLAYYRQKPASIQYGVVSVEDVIEPNNIKPYTVEVQLFKKREWLEVIEVLKDVKDRIYYKIKNDNEMRVVHIDDINHFRFK